MSVRSRTRGSYDIEARYEDRSPRSITLKKRDVGDTQDADIQRTTDGLICIPVESLLALLGLGIGVRM